MSRDYKTSRHSTPAKKRRRVSSKTKPRKSKKGTPGWVWLLCGLGIGLAIAVATYFLVQPQTTTAIIFLGAGLALTVFLTAGFSMLAVVVCGWTRK
jgi:hypothetical protein